MTQPVLVVGATGILAPAVAELVAAGHRVLAVARTAADLDALAGEYGERVRTLPADGTDPGFVPRVADAVVGRPLAGALLYGPAIDHAGVTGVAGLSAGPVVHVLTSAASAPGHRLPEPPAGVRRLLLGWHPTGRWHTAAEVSAAAVALWEAGSEADRVLGVVRPWQERPS